MGTKDLHHSKMKKYRRKLSWKETAQISLQFLSKGADIILTLRGLRQKPHVSDYIAAGVKILDLSTTFAKKKREREPNILELYQEHSGKEWRDLGRSCHFEKQIVQKVALKAILIDEDRAYKLFQATIDGYELIWKTAGAGEDAASSMLSDGPYVHKEHLHEALGAIGKLFWADIEGQCCTIEAPPGSNNYSFMQDELGGNALPSKLASDTAARLDKFVKKGVERAVLFYGPQGTGKSTAIRTIAEHLGLKTLRVSFTTLSRRSDNIDMVLISALRMMQPGVLIIDDIDRVEDAASMVSYLDLFRKHVKVLMASANRPEKLDPAVLRPERFDFAIRVRYLDQGVLMRLVGENVAPEILKKLQRLPIVYVNEYVLRLKHLGEEEANITLDSMYARMEKSSIQSAFDTVEGDFETVEVERIAVEEEDEKTPANPESSVTKTENGVFVSAVKATTPKKGIPEKATN